MPTTIDANHVDFPLDIVSVLIVRNEVTAKLNFQILADNLLTDVL
jgi:ssRNA-specific RNase YbeY (16S rRNA maturation enzyme)